MTVLTPSFLPGARSGLASAGSPPSPPCAALGPVHQPGCCRGQARREPGCFSGRRKQLLRLRAVKQERQGRAQVLLRFPVEVGRNKALCPCLCQSPHLVIKRGEKSPCPEGDVKFVSIAAAMMSLMARTLFWHGSRWHLGMPFSSSSALPG